MPHASSFDGVLAQVTEVYSPTSESSSKRKKFRHNMGCCQATLITELPARAAQANKTTGVFLSKIDRECEDDHSDGEDVLDDHHHNTGVALQGATATATTATRTEHAVAASSEECITPPASTKKVAAKKKSQDLTPSKRSNRVIDKDKRSTSTKSKPQVLDLTASVSPKKPAGRKMTQEVMAPPPAATTVAKKRKKRKRISLAPARKKAVGRIGMAVHEGWSEKNVREL